MVFALSDIATYLLAQGVVVVARVADGQQVTVLGIEDEQETVEENQGGLAHFLQRRLGRCGSDGPGKLRKDLAEDQSGKIGADAFLVKLAFLDGTLVERPRISRSSNESLPPENEYEHLKPMVPLGFGEGKQAVIVAREIEKRREVDFKELLRDGPGALVIESPPCAVGEEAPAQLTGRSSTRRR